MTVPQLQPGLIARVESALWSGGAHPRWKGSLLRFLRTLMILGRDLSQGQLTLRAKPAA